MDNVPCTACSWSVERQDECNYQSRVKLVYAASNRGVWSLGSRYMLKQRGKAPPYYDIEHAAFVRENTSIPAPEIVDAWEESDGTSFTLTKRVPGEPLSDLWPTLSMEEKDSIAKETASALGALRRLQSSAMCAVGQKPIHSAFLFFSDFERPHGPIVSDEDLWQEITKGLRNVPAEILDKVRKRMPPAAPYTFTHGDLFSGNIMVHEGKLSGILDWEASGYFPVWWEFTAACIGQGQDDKEWKDLLRKYMPDYTSAREFWRSLYYLRNYPVVDGPGKALLQELGC